MPTHEFLNHCKTRRAELESELDALARIISIHDGSPAQTAGGEIKTKARTGSEQSTKTVRITPEHKARIRELIAEGKKAVEIVAYFKDRYPIQIVYGQRSEMKKQGLLK